MLLSRGGAETEREREREEREGDRGSEAGSVLRREEPDVGLELTNCEIMT